MHDFSRIGYGPPWLGPNAYSDWRRDGADKANPARLDVVLLTHPRDEYDLPRLFEWSTALSLAERRELVRHVRPIIGEVIVAPRFSAGLLFLPMFAADIIDPVERQRCRQTLEREGLELAARTGARIVCLGGLTGALTGYGRRIADACADLGLTITTGHAATACSVVRAFRRAIDDTGRDMTSMRVALLGVGSVGAAVGRLLAYGSERPAEIVLIDTPRRADHLRGIAATLQANGIASSIELTTLRGELIETSACYAADAVISAVSTPYVLDIDRVAPGTVLVDDSQPYCWSREAAWQRCATRGDIVPCDAGLVDCSSLGFASSFPFDFVDMREGRSHTSWSCLTEGLLRTIEPALPMVVGEPTLETLLIYQDAFDRHGLTIPPLQCGIHRLPVEDLRWNGDVAMSHAVAS